jgi:hypothetical protein
MSKPTVIIATQAGTRRVARTVAARFDSYSEE